MANRLGYLVIYYAINVLGVAVCLGEPESHVHGSIIDGVFAGRIETPTDTFYIDKSENYFQQAQSFHSVIYSDRDMNTSPRWVKSLYVARYLQWSWLENVTQVTRNHYM